MTHPIDVPVISEEPVASVLRVLGLREIGEDLFEALSLPQVRRVYGGQVIAQSLIAAQATLADPGRLPHSLHAYFLRGGDPDAPFQLQAERLRDGRSFSDRRVTCRQEDREIFSMLASFQRAEHGLSFAVRPPDVPRPDDLPSALELFRSMDHPAGRFLGKTAAFDVRHVQHEVYTRVDRERSPRQQLWMRPRARIPAGALQAVHRALAAYAIDQVMMEPALRQLGLCWMTPEMSAASLDHAMWFHRDLDINEWLLYDGSCSQAGGGRALTSCRVFSEDGELVAEASQQAMIRIPMDGREGSGNWSFVDSPMVY